MTGKSASLYSEKPGELMEAGMFTYGPGRVPPPLHLGVPSSLIAGSFPPSGVINPIRQSKRLYIGGIKDEMTEDELEKFFNDLMHEHLIAADMPGEPVTQVQINTEKSFAFCEVRRPLLQLSGTDDMQFRTADEASSAMQFDGVMCDGIPLRVRRPKDYIGIDPSLGFPGIAGTTVGESPNKLFIGGLPTYLNDEQVMELLKSFGELRSFNLVKESAAGGESKVRRFEDGYALTVRASLSPSISIRQLPTWLYKVCTTSSSATEHSSFSELRSAATPVSHPPSLDPPPSSPKPVGLPPTYMIK